MKIIQIAISTGVTIIVIIVGLAAITPVIFTDRVWPGVYAAETDLTGLDFKDLQSTLIVSAENIEDKVVVVELNGKWSRHSLKELGFGLDIVATAKQARSARWFSWLRWPAIFPELQVNRSRFNAVIRQDFGSLIDMPKNASVALNGTYYSKVPGAAGEGPDVPLMMAQISRDIQTNNLAWPITIALAPAVPDVSDEAAALAAEYANGLLSESFQVSAGEQAWQVKAFTLKRLITFSEQSSNAGGAPVLKVSFDSQELKSYLDKTIAPEVNQDAQDARFNMVNGRIEQFAMPRAGKKVDMEASVNNIQKALASRALSAQLAVVETQPRVADQAGAQSLGINKLLTTAITDFSGSPQNRRHNIEVGVTRYHGLLVAPGEEFSFLDHLGPVDAEHDFKPELVIKNHLTIPEFGGGLCQVSTTVFRAAVQAGMKVTQRRNHAYAVRYYGKPGFDATIYPPYTDLRFINNTPGHLLIQAQVKGNQVVFELWGTDDGRQVEVIGPTTYGAQPDGSVNARLTEKVTRAGETVVDQTFVSRYKSPDLFPRTVAADDPNRTNNANNQPTSNPNPTANPAAPAR